MKSVIFLDLDETLVAQERAFSRSFEAVAELVDRSVQEIQEIAERTIKETDCADVVRRCCFGGRDVLWADPGNGTAAEREIARCADRYRRDVWASAAGDSVVAGRLGDAFISSMRASMTLFPDAAPVVARLAGRARLAVITNGMRDAQQIKLERLGLAPYFERLISSTEVGRGKPAAEIFRYAVEEMGVDPRKAVMVGDSLDGDVAGALGAGMDAVWINRDAAARGRAGLIEVSALNELEAVV